MKKLLLLLLGLMLALPAVAQPVVCDSVATDSVAHRKKVAVVLSGGGAFGAVHVGALKVLEEAGLPVDMVVGTSMGSIVGALYSVGYDSDDIATMFHCMDWTELFLDRKDQHRLTLKERDAQNTYFFEREFYVGKGIDPEPGGVIRGHNVEDALEYYLQGYTDSIDFMRDLPRKFACVATDLVTDSAVVFTSGSLVKSVRASMSIPGLFTPVRLDSMVLVDGGAKNNFAADVAHRLGADIVIGIRFTRGLGTDKGPKYRTIIDVLERAGGSDVSRRARDNEKYCNLVVRVPVKGYTSGSFTRKSLDSLMTRGERAMREQMDTLLALKSLLGVSPSQDYTLHLRDIDDLAPLDEGQAGLVDIREPNTVGTSPGLRFDTEDFAAMQLRGRYFMGGKVRKELDLTLRLGRRSMLRVGFDVEPWHFKRMGVSYEFWYKYLDLYTKGKRSDNLSLIYQHANVKLFALDAPNFDLELGFGWEHYHQFRPLWNEHSEVIFPSNEHYFNYHVALRYNNEDRRYFTRRGIRAEARAAYYTDNFAQWNGHTGFGAVAALWQMTVPLAHDTHLRWGVQGRLLFGDDIPVMKHNMAGGMSQGKFFPQQMPLAGMGHVEFFDTKMVSASLRLQQRIVGQHYLLLDGSVAEHNDTLGGLFDRKPLWGIQLGYFYNSSLAGPLGATIGWNSHTHRVNFLLSLGFDF
ncbi:MAG: patatin-like phospholipase family protein [Muribaculaceae bacterium]|nr:patatin-like phospholipase family protein [Muribaculaceae bacterium]